MVHDQFTFWLSETPEKPSVGWDASMERICTYAAFTDKTKNDTLHIFNTHFDHIGEIARENSAKLILKKIEELGLLSKKVIVMGDLNSKPSEAPVSVLKSSLRDAFEFSFKKPYGPIGTFNNFDENIIPENRIDYIFTRNLKVLSYRCINDKRKNALCISDHLPVFTEILHTK